jgi:hypothetical protein
MDEKLQQQQHTWERIFKEYFCPQCLIITHYYQDQACRKCHLCSYTLLLKEHPLYPLKKEEKE